MIEVVDAHKSFGRIAAVRGVSLSIGGGEVVGLLGPNGAGKSTTIRMITGFLPPDAGRVRVNGHDTVEDSIAARRAIGYLPESAPLYPEMSVRGFLDFRGRLYGLDRATRRARIAAVMERLKLTDVRERRIGQLSKGYKQRTGLAAALLHEPPVLVLDEPSNGLDPTQVLEMRGLIRELGRSRCVLVSSHVLSEIEHVCSRVVIMGRGKVLADGTPAALVARASGRDRAIVIEFASSQSDEQCVAALRAVRGVGEVVLRSLENGWRGALVREVVREVEARPGEAVHARPDPREAIAAAAAGWGWTIRELHRNTPTLERMFFELLEAGGDAGVAGAAAADPAGVAGTSREGGSAR